MSTPQEGQHRATNRHDLYEIQALFEEICSLLKEDEELYKDKSVIEHANAWIDGFKALLVRFEFTARNWMGLHCLETKKAKFYHNVK